MWYAINYVLCSFHQCEVMAGFSALLSSLNFWLTVSMADQQKHVRCQHTRTLAENRPIVVYASSKDHPRATLLAAQRTSGSDLLLSGHIIAEF